jgi:hypothetical protein
MDGREIEEALSMAFLQIAVTGALISAGVVAVAFFMAFVFPGA